MRIARRRGQRAFTLVELLVVITIIGILAAILVPTVNIVITRAKNARISLEMKQLETALEDYKLKYGDYPPDCSNLVVLDRHLTTAFPRISLLERTAVLRQFGSIDPAEALVFFLGGLSSDPKAPFTGHGGPLKPRVDSSGTPLTDANGYLYAANDQRNAPLFTFIEQRLRQYREAVGTYSNLFSNDEQTLHGLTASDNDAFPVYFPPGLETPYVYFDSRTYIHNPINNPTPQLTAVPFQAVYPPVGYQATLVEGHARPYRSDTSRAVNVTSYDQVPFQWVNEKTFQILTSGLDNNFGADNFFKRFPSGANYGMKDSNADNVVDSDSGLFDQAADNDNICNFADGPLGDSIP